MNKIYQVLIQDNYNNLHLIGFYKQLKDSINDINEFLSIYNIKITKKDLIENIGIFNTNFDLDLSSIFEKNDNAYGLYIRGFVLEGLDL